MYGRGRQPASGRIAHSPLPFQTSRAKTPSSAADGSAAAVTARPTTTYAAPAFDASWYKKRNTVERCFSKLKQFRAVATRYDKRERIYQGTIDVASISIWLRDPVP